ncbi:MAG: S9 family peptidase [Ruminococcaceae bacterium]|jgi:dipeptidyl aminopeptidase/acylaminoacyl peptidase|nr:S9 family peptidase [Oscillospiraceae bacterium]
MKKVTYSDLYEFNFLSDVSYSPDGKHALFAKHNACEKTNGYKSYIWLLDAETGETKQLTFGGAERGAKWLDNESILFTANRSGEKSKKPRTEYYKLTLTGGEAQPLFTIPERAVSCEPMGDGKYLLAIVKHCEGKEEKADDEAMDGRDLYVFDEIYFWFNGQGIRNKLRNSLVIYDTKTKRYKQISKKYTNVAGAAMSPDKTKVLFCGPTYENMSTRESALFLYDVPTGKTKTIVRQDKYAIGAPCFMGDDKAFFTLNELKFSGQNPYFCKLDVATGEYERLPYADMEAGGAVGTDCNYGGGSNKKFYDGKLYMTKSVWGNAHLMAMDMDGNFETVDGNEGSINAFDIANGKVLMTAMRNMDLIELYSLDLKTGEEKRLTTFNKEYHDTHSVVAPEYFTFKDRDGVELDAYVIKPLGYKPGKKYPAILEMHGGPKGIFGPVFHHEMQCLVNMGYFVFYTNPRGSDGRGSEFAAMTGNLGKLDFNDFMDFTDEILKQYPDIDEKRVGICGGSYGGFMCNWMIGHTDRYAAAASQRSISNYFTKSLCTDIGYNHNMSQLDTDPWEDWATVWETSPLKNAHLAKTPTLFIQSDEDYRCWMSDALQMFSALKMNGVDSRVALFHGENHELSRSGKPKNRISRLTEICEWFEKYVKPVK